MHALARVDRDWLPTVSIGGTDISRIIIGTWQVCHCCCAASTSAAADACFASCTLLSGVLVSVVLHLSQLAKPP